MGDDTIDNVNYEELYKNFLESSDIEDLENELQKPNIFNILGAQRMEIRHSNFLAWLLDPNGSHGLGNRFLIRVLRDLAIDKKSKLNILEIGDLNFANVDVIREHPCSNGKRIDILILIEYEKHNDKKLILCIENKIDSVDFDNQLCDYRDYVNKTYQEPEYKKLFVYLTPNGEEPSDDNERNEWFLYSYKDHILKHLTSIPKKTINTEVKIYINDYLSILNNEIMNNNITARELADAIYDNHKPLIDFIVANRDKNLGFQQYWEIDIKWVYNFALKLKVLIEEINKNDEYVLGYTGNAVTLRQKRRNEKRYYNIYSVTKKAQPSCGLEFNFLKNENDNKVIEEVKEFVKDLVAKSKQKMDSKINCTDTSYFTINFVENLNDDELIEILKKRLELNNQL